MNNNFKVDKIKNLDVLFDDLLKHSEDIAILKEDLIIMSSSEDSLFSFLRDIIPDINKEFIKHSLSNPRNVFNLGLFLYHLLFFSTVLDVHRHKNQWLSNWLKNLYYNIKGSKESILQHNKDIEEYLNLARDNDNIKEFARKNVLELSNNVFHSVHNNNNPLNNNSFVMPPKDMSYITSFADFLNTEDTMLQICFFEDGRMEIQFRYVYGPNFVWNIAPQELVENTDNEKKYTYIENLDPNISSALLNLNDLCEMSIDKAPDVAPLILGFNMGNISYHGKIEPYKQNGKLYYILFSKE